ncbi:MAG: HyaD/HybD family hydrogenase maturation endopeptidase [Thermodesulfovibrionaceae bacterium]
MKIGVIGVGNILLRDDGVGPKVVEQLKKNYIFEPEVEIIDGGTLGLDLLHYLEEFERLIIIDIADFGKEPGFIDVVKADDIPPYLKPKLSAHHVGIQDLLEVAKFIGVLPKEIIFIIST